MCVDFDLEWLCQCRKIHKVVVTHVVVVIVVLSMVCKWRSQSTTESGVIVEILLSMANDILVISLQSLIYQGTLQFLHAFLEFSILLLQPDFIVLLLCIHISFFIQLHFHSVPVFL